MCFFLFLHLQKKPLSPLPAKTRWQRVSNSEAVSSFVVVAAGASQSNDDLEIGVPVPAVFIC